MAEVMDFVYARQVIMSSDDICIDNKDFSERAKSLRRGI